VLEKVFALDEVEMAADLGVFSGEAFDFSARKAVAETGV
jgi:hypothetical protein